MIVSTESLKQLGHELEPLKNCVNNARDEVKSMATSLRVLLSEHHKIFVDVRSLLKSMMKVRFLVYFHDSCFSISFFLFGLSASVYNHVIFI